MFLVAFEQKKAILAKEILDILKMNDEYWLYDSYSIIIIFINVIPRQLRVVPRIVSFNHVNIISVEFYRTQGQIHDVLNLWDLKIIWNDVESEI